MRRCNLLLRQPYADGEHGRGAGGKKQHQSCCGHPAESSGERGFGQHREYERATIRWSAQDMHTGIQRLPPHRLVDNLRRCRAGVLPLVHIDLAVTVGVETAQQARLIALPFREHYAGFARAILWFVVRGPGFEQADGV